MNSELSVVVCFKNDQDFIVDAINSVLNQSYNEFDLYLIDDGSTDDSLKLVTENFSEKATIFHYNESLGLAKRLNDLIPKLNTKYLARMDGDDLISEDRFSKQVRFLETNFGIDLVSTGVKSIDENGNVLGQRLPKTDVTLTFNNIFRTQHGIVHASIIGKTEFFKRNPYDPKLLRAQDHELWLRCYLNGDLNIGFIPEPLYYYRETLNVTKEKLVKAYEISLFLLGNYAERAGLSNFEIWKFRMTISAKLFLLKVSPFSILKFLMLRRRLK